MKKLTIVLIAILCLGLIGAGFALATDRISVPQITNPFMALTNAISPAPTPINRTIHEKYKTNLTSNLQILSEINKIALQERNGKIICDYMKLTNQTVGKTEDFYCKINRYGCNCIWL